MGVEMDQTAGEIKRLKACINDLVSVLALPAIWSGHEPSQIVSTLLDVLLGMLRLDFAYARLSDSIGGGAPIEMVRLAQGRNLTAPPQEFGQALNPWLAGDPGTAPLVLRNPTGEGELSIAPLRLGLQDEVGVLVVGSQRTDFPTDTEKLLLRVAANQAAIALQEARRLGEQKRAAEELEQRVVERTRQLTAVNEELRKEIIERKRAEEELRRSEAFLTEGQSLGHTGSWGWHASNGAVTWSPEHFRILGLKPDTMASLDVFWEQVHPEDRPGLQQTFEKAIREKREFASAFRIVRPDGSSRHVHGVGRPIVNESDELVEFIGTTMDITERKRAEEELHQAQASLAHVTRVTTLGEMTSSIAHEVNQPLAAMVNNASACLRWLAAQNQEEARQSAALIIADAHRASDIIGRIRAFVKKAPPQKDWLNINEIVLEVITLARSEVQGNRVSLQTHLADDVPLIVGDRIQVQQVLLNLLTNAIEAMSGSSEGPRELQIGSATEAAQGVRVTVRDSGPGLDPESLAQLFTAFYTTKPHGMGMGLAISRSIIEAHGGRLWATANAGRGAVFQFTLPRGGERAV
jgi:PAS domain S-box-containing protein